MTGKVENWLEEACSCFELGSRVVARIFRESITNVRDVKLNTVVRDKTRRSHSAKEKKKITALANFFSFFSFFAFMNFIRIAVVEFTLNQHVQHKIRQNVAHQRYVFYEKGELCNFILHFFYWRLKKKFTIFIDWKIF